MSNNKVRRQYRDFVCYRVLDGCDKVDCKLLTTRFNIPEFWWVSFYDPSTGIKYLFFFSQTTITRFQCPVLLLSLSVPLLSQVRFYLTIKVNSLWESFSPFSFRKGVKFSFTNFTSFLYNTFTFGCVLLERSILVYVKQHGVKELLFLHTIIYGKI